MKLPTRAVVRPPADTFASALTRDSEPQPVDLALACQQHALYVNALKAVGLAVTELPPDPDFPDSCFTQDPVLIADGILVACRMGAQSRRREEKALINALADLELPKYTVTKPATLEGGDVLITEDSLFVGLTSRTDMNAVKQLRDVFSANRKVVAVSVPDRFLHLGTGCSYLGEGRLLTSVECAALPEFAKFQKLVVPEAEWYAANALAVGPNLVIADGFPATAEMLTRTGFTVHPVPLSEFAKRDGSVTCLSLVG
jgi:dimethylargininase